MTSKPNYLFERNKNFKSIEQNLIRVDTLELAIAKLDYLKSIFTVSKKSDPADRTSAIFWVEYFAITEEEKAKGYRGNFARIYATKLDNGQYTLVVEKIPEDVRHHPERIRPKQQMPDWGHPILRSIRKGHVYVSKGDAWRDLQKLHQDFPKTAILVSDHITDCLYIMIFSKETEPRTKKYVFEVVEVERGFTITYRENRNIVQPATLKIDEMFDSPLDLISRTLIPPPSSRDAAPENPPKEHS